MITDDLIRSMAKQLPEEVIQSFKALPLERRVYAREIAAAFKRLEWLELLINSEEGVIMLCFMEELVELGLARKEDGRVFPTETGHRLAQLLMCLMLTNRDKEERQNG